MAATRADLPALLRMGRAFHEAVAPEWPWSDEGFAQTIMAAPYVRLTSGGFIAGLIAPMPLNPNWIVGHELLWWAEDGSGLRLMRGFREWCIANGANEIKWSCRADNERVKRFYGRFAKPTEAVFSEGI